MSLFPTAPQQRKDGGQGWNILPISHIVITSDYVTSENRIIQVESFYRRPDGLGSCQLYFVDRDLQRVVFPPISRP